MSGASCIGTPISWLRLERYHLGEIAEDEKKAIAEHVASCPACAACLARVEEDDAAPLAPLPAKKTTGRVLSLRRVAPIAGALAAAAAILFVLGKNPSAPDVPTENRVKGGGEPSFALVRDDEALIEEAGGSFHDGDRFKVLVTCPPDGHPRFDLVVWDAEGASFPLAAASDVACGNRVALPGAFRVTGSSRMTVCLLASDAGAIDRERVRRSGLASIPPDACKTLDPAP